MILYIIINIRRHSQAVRQRSAKPSPPVQFRVAPPCRSKVRFAPFFVAQKTSARSLAPPFPKKVTFASAKPLQARTFYADLLATNFFRFRAITGQSWSAFFFSAPPEIKSIFYKEGSPPMGRAGRRVHASTPATLL